MEDCPGWRRIVVRFNDVDFGTNSLRFAKARAAAAAGGEVEIHLDETDGPLLACVKIAPDLEWKVVQSELPNVPTGLHDLVVINNGDGRVNWIGSALNEQNLILPLQN